MSANTTPSAPTRRSPGRPRASNAVASPEQTREEILTTAARLFGAQGYTKTTTRQIASEVGIRQASLYYHFSDKAAILHSLLVTTIQPSVDFAAWLHSRDEPAATLLYALARFDLDSILGDERNLHLLIGPGADRPSEVEGEQQQLRIAYRDFARAALAEAGSDGYEETDLDLAFGLVEGLIAQRHWGELTTRARYARSIARGVLRLVDSPASSDSEIEAAAASLILMYRVEHDDR